MVTVGNIEGGDIGVIVGYFVIVLAVGLIASCRNRGSVGGYFLAGRQMHWIPVGASLFASNIGSGHFIGLAGSGASSGIGISVFELNAVFILVILGWIFLPVYVSTGVYTMPEFLKRRFGGVRIRIYLAALALLLYICTKISADLYAGAIFIEQSFKLPLYPSIIILLVFAGVFNILGGLSAVIWTDFIQSIIMIIGAFYLMVQCLLKLGGYEMLIEKYFQSVATSALSFTAISKTIYPINNSFYECGMPDKNAMHLMRSADDGNLPWPGVIFGLTISSVWYWCTDQVIVQRALAAKNLTHGKAGIIMCGFLKMLPMWLMVVPGMASRILYPEDVACNVPELCKKICGKPRGCSDLAFPKLVVELLPVGARGLMIAVMLASLVSSLTSIFNSASTIFTMDIWTKIRKNKCKDVELMIVGRVFVLVLIGVGIAWIPIVQMSNELFHYIQSVTSYLAPPICAIYILALFWKRCNEKGAFTGLMFGLVVGLIRFVLEIIYGTKPCGETNSVPAVVAKVHYLHFGIILFFITIIVTMLISWVTAPLEDRFTNGLLYWNCRKAYPLKPNEYELGQDNLNYESTENPETMPTEASNTRYEDHEDDQVSIPWYKKAAYWVCGIENMHNKNKEPEMTEDELEIIRKKQTNIKEKNPWKTITNVFCVILLTMTIFYWGFYA